MRTVCLVLALWMLPLAVTAPALASCGSEGSCPLVNPEAPFEARLRFDVAHLYIDQNQPKVGSEAVAVGAIPGHHDEVRTVNRVTNFRVSYRSAGWVLGATLPYLNRSHEHIHHHLGEDEYERWSDSGLGDLEVTVTRVTSPASGRQLRAGLGFRAPTGKQSPALSASGDELEPSARLGTGAWSLLAEAGAAWRVPAPGRSDDVAMPIRVGITGRYHGRGVEDYRHGAEVMAHVGADYPVGGPLAFLLQTNYRVRAKDDVGDAGEEEAGNTGGAALYVTPGLRVDAMSGLSIYGLAQFPIWERVNGIQVVAESNLVFGISRSLF